MAKQSYRTLTIEEIKALESNGCRAGDWDSVRVAGEFDPQRITGVTFKGAVYIGRLEGEIDPGDGVLRGCGIRSANLCDVTMGDGCVISRVGGWLSKVDIGDDVLIEDVGDIVCSRETTFGNGHMIAVLNEGGGRELPICTRTSAQIAYLHVMYRERGQLMEGLARMAQRHCAQIKSSHASIGAHARIRRCRTIQNVWIGPHATVDGAMELRNGTIDSSKEAPGFVGPGVIAHDFIFQKGCSVSDGAVVSASLVGEASRMGRQFSSENSAFFANSEAFHSEACSVFAGPYSVTHHRSTLLIAVYSSFYNAGSGTNQSNHMYKLGPLHQGILERGCKTGSFSYLLWPCRIGAFTAVIGKHYSNFDTSDFPFSYISEEEGRSTLVPGMNFFTVGTLRDIQKWPARDRRTSAEKLDCIVYEALSPYTAQKMIAGQKILTDLYEKGLKEFYDQAEKKPEWVVHKGINIKRLLLKTCRRYYGLILDKYFGDVIAKRLARHPAKDIAGLCAYAPAGEKGNGEWADIGGLICPKARVERCIGDVCSDKIRSYDELLAAFRSISEAYEDDEWNWFLSQYRETHGVELAQQPADEFIRIVDAWKSASAKLLNMVRNDAEKEFDEGTRIGFGIDGGRDEDFTAVRGTFETNSFVKQLKAQMEAMEKNHALLMSLEGK